jgi:hypothetical protein
MNNETRCVPPPYEEYYLKSVSFEPIIKKLKEKSEEVYFGLDNPLRTGLIYHLDVINNLITAAKEKNPNVHGLELVDICKGESEKLEKLITDSFNIEKCAIGFQNSVNASCYPQIYNKKIAGKSEDANITRIKLDDIIETKNGFRYKDGKGIYYALSIGLQFFNGHFTIPEIACAVIHELGHAMEHVVHDINAVKSIAYWSNIMKGLSLEYISPYDIPPKIGSILKLIEKSHVNKDYKKLSKIGKDILDETDPKDMVDFYKMDSHEITAINNDETPIDGSDVDDVKKRKNIFIRTLVGTLKILLSIPFAPIFVILIVGLKFSLRSKKSKLYKFEEMTADSFEVFYGFGSESGELSKKLSKYRSDSGDMGLINYLPLLNLYKCYKDIEHEQILMILGYPSDRQRIVNAYIACDFELKNNKDLSSDSKKELRDQMNMLKDTYNDFVLNHDTKGGFIYKISSIVGKNTIEKAAQKDKDLIEGVLKPLQNKKESGAFI